MEIEQQAKDLALTSRIFDEGTKIAISFSLANLHANPSLDRKKKSVAG